MLQIRQRLLIILLIRHLKIYFNRNFFPLHDAFMSKVNDLSTKQEHNSITLLQLQIKTEFHNGKCKYLIVYNLDDPSKTPLNNFALKNCLFGETNIAKIVKKVSMCIAAMEEHLMVQVHGVLVMTILGML